MCTAITLRASDGASYIGRNMDFSYEMQPRFYFVPPNYRWSNPAINESMRNAYSFIGIGQELDGTLAFFDGVNEHGFAAAALYFAGYANYSAKAQNLDEIQVASYDFLHYMLANCMSVEDLCRQIDAIEIVGQKDPLTQTVAPLHWIAADKSGACVVLEQTERGMEIFCNSIGALANSPDFRWHMTNLRNYMQVSPYQQQEQLWGEVKLTPFGQAGGTTLLPGGYTSPERFVRTAYLKSHIPTPESAQDALISFFQIMKSVSIPRGAVVTVRGTDDYTQYTAFIDIHNRQYFFNSYDNLQVKRVSFPAKSTMPDTLVDLGKMMQPMSCEKL